MSIERSRLFEEIMNSFLEKFSELEAIIVSDIDGLIIAGEKRKDIESDIEIVSVLSTMITPILERIRNEFAFKKFGTASFDTDEYRLLFISVDEERILSLIFNGMASIEKISPYAYLLAEKVAQILSARRGDEIQIEIPKIEESKKGDQILKRKFLQTEDLASEHQQYTFKFIVIGDHEVGKTSLLRKFVENKFSHNYRATIGLNILSHKFNFEGNEISLNLWDIGAQQYFKRFRKIYYSGTEAAFIVFDITERKSFENIKIWKEELSEFIKDDKLPIVIVGNKSDLADQRQVRSTEAEELASNLSEYGASYIETSALTGENVEDAFKLISLFYIVKTKKQAKGKIKENLIDTFHSAISELIILELTFLSETMNWCPGYQAIADIEELGNKTVLKNTLEERKIAYDNGLIITNHSTKNYNITNSDGVFCIFDVREQEHINPEWKNILLDILQKIKKQRVIIIGLRISDDSNWSQLMDEFSIEEELEEKLVSILFLKIGPDYREKIYEYLTVMLNAIVNTRKLK